MNVEQNTPQCQESDTKYQRCILEEGHQELHLSGAGAEWAIIKKATPSEQSKRKGRGIPVADRLIELIRERTQVGEKKYGEPLTTHNGRDPMLDALQESLDLNQYLMQMIMEVEDQIDHLSYGQIKPLADYLLSVGNPNPDESACEMAIRLLKDFGGNADRSA